MQAHFRKGMALVRMGRLADAIEAFREGMRFRGDLLLLASSRVRGPLIEPVVVPTIGRNVNAGNAELNAEYEAAVAAYEAELARPAETPAGAKERGNALYGDGQVRLCVAGAGIREKNTVGG